MGGGAGGLSQLHGGCSQNTPLDQSPAHPRAPFEYLGNSTLPKGTSTVLWRCTGRSYKHTFHLFLHSCIVLGLKPLLSHSSTSYRLSYHYHHSMVYIICWQYRYIFFLIFLSQYQILGFEFLSWYLIYCFNVWLTRILLLVALTCMDATYSFLNQVICPVETQEQLT